MKKILFCIGTLQVGGAESQLVKLMLQLKKKGWDCEIYLINSEGPLLDVVQDNCIRIHDGGFNFQESKVKKFLFMMRAFCRLAKAIWRFKPDVLHAYLPLTNFMGAFLGFFFRVPKIITSRRGMGSHQEKRPIFKLLDKMANYFSSTVTVNSKAVAESVISLDGINPKKMIQVPNGMSFLPFKRAKDNRYEIRRELGLREDETAIVMIANLIPYKGHLDFIHSFPDVLRQYPKARAFFAGSELGRSAELRSVAESLGVADSITFLGRRDDVPNLLSAMDLYVMASHEEGCSNALLEAMASGVPIVATDVGGNKEVLNNGQCGWVIPPHDPSSLSLAIVNALQDKDKNEKIEMAKSHVKKNYSLDAMVKAHLQIYKEA